jgi:hypothetical protein
MAGTERAEMVEEEIEGRGRRRMRRYGGSEMVEDEQTKDRERQTRSSISK